MKYSIHSLRTALASLIVAMIVTIGTGLPISAHAATDADKAKAKAESEEKKVKIRKEDERNLKGKDSFYVQQAKALAEQYRETAAMVAQQGGNPQGLLKAAAYFQSQADNLFSAR
ncbi:hypothetical protein [Nitrosomonas sp. Nm58]|uniref:hypothetical protein n=1 Tax=Nitrosomonas sp. Nm58 TaxID=200126 RepID=UPI00089AD358|nr:hypothetical protein [Nitrosomonas sp. Nm58]SDY87444.1 hypothetical protein SAMN05421754_10278 [Nitrosomonas sp. Nm58]